EVRRRLRRAPDARELCHLVRLDVEFKTGLNYRRVNRVVPAPRTQRAKTALVVIKRVPKRILRQSRVAKFWSKIAHFRLFQSSDVISLFRISATSRNIILN